MWLRWVSKLGAYTESAVNGGWRHPCGQGVCPPPLPKNGPTSPSCGKRADVRFKTKYLSRQSSAAIASAACWFGFINS